MTIGPHLLHVPSERPESSSRRERKRAETRQRIFRAAMELFAKHGFLATTVEEITEAADVGKGTFFNYFPSKEHVLGVLHEVQLAKVAEARKAAEKGDQPIREVLHKFMYRIAEEPGRSQQLARGLVVTMISSEYIRDIFIETLTRGAQMLSEVLKRGQERGEIRTDLTPEEMVRIFQQNILGALVHWSITSTSTLQERLDPTFEIFWSGISRQAAR
ncbi:MAG TPA: TetR family transcriptional regulator [Terriglobales bacterium]|nr:TetR family transcriptional regulator [Terriglobales bacterium]